MLDTRPSNSFILTGLKYTLTILVRTKTLLFMKKYHLGILWSTISKGTSGERLHFVCRVKQTLTDIISPQLNTGLQKCNKNVNCCYLEGKIQKSKDYTLRETFYHICQKGISMLLSKND